MNEKKFLKPQVEIINFVNEDIITESDGQIASLDINGLPIDE